MISKIKEILADNQIDLSFIADFKDDHKSDLIMIGYSEISLDKIEDGIALLNKIFKYKEK